MLKMLRVITIAILVLAAEGGNVLEPRCFQEMVGGRLAFRTDCAKFVQCVSTSVGVVKLCPSGLHFNAESELCDFPSRAGCGNMRSSFASANCECDCEICCPSCTQPSETTYLTNLTPTEATSHGSSAIPDCKPTPFDDISTPSETPISSSSLSPTSPTSTIESPTPSEGPPTPTPMEEIPTPSDSPITSNSSPTPISSDGTHTPCANPTSDIDDATTPSASLTSSNYLSTPTTSDGPPTPTAGPTSPTDDAPTTSDSPSPSNSPPVPTTSDGSPTPTVGSPTPTDDVPTPSHSSTPSNSPPAPTPSGGSPTPTAGSPTPTNDVPTPSHSPTPSNSPPTPTPSDGSPTPTPTDDPPSSSDSPTPSNSSPTSTPDGISTPTAGSLTSTDEAPTPSDSSTPSNSPPTPTPAPTDDLPTPTVTEEPSDCDAVCCNKNDGFTHIFEGNCQKFIVCVDGKDIVFTCSNNLQYNSATGECDYPDNVECQWPQPPPSGPSAGPSGTHCETGGRCVGQRDGTSFTNESSECSSDYVVCQCECEVKRSCSSPLMFNVELGVCDWPTSFGC